MIKLEYNTKEFLDYINGDEIQPNFIRLREAAIEVSNRGRFLKSTTYVGCSLLTNKDKIYYGCNFDFEWGIAIHSEETAICNMISHGGSDELINKVYIYCERDNLTPCGSCRDKLRLYSVKDEDIEIIIDNGKCLCIYKLSELIPFYPKR